MSDLSTFELCWNALTVRVALLDDSGDCLHSRNFAIAVIKQYLIMVRRDCIP